jgi:predicted DsbA family dithiol-disulfide isomerase
MKTVEGIYHKYFSEGKDIRDVAVLASVAMENGVFDRQDPAKAWLGGNEEMEEYNAAVLETWRQISAVFCSLGVSRSTTLQVAPS